MVTQTMDAKPDALPSRMLPEQPRTLVQQPLILMYLPVLLVISEQLVALLLLVLQTLAVLVAMDLPLTLAHLVHTRMEVTALAPVLQTHKLVKIVQLVHFKISTTQTKTVVKLVRLVNIKMQLQVYLVKNVQRVHFLIPRVMQATTIV